MTVRGRSGADASDAARLDSAGTVVGVGKGIGAAENLTIVRRLAAALDAPLVHVSTDYVFDGHRGDAYGVDDPVQPLNVYGVTKLAGELAVRTLCAKHWVLRTSWVFSEHGANFVKTMLRAAQSGKALRVVADQRGRPTYAGDLARLIGVIVRRRETKGALAYGTYHAVGGPAVSWHDFALAIFRAAQEHGLLRELPVETPIPTAEYPTPARRPMSAVLAPSIELDALARHYAETGAPKGEVTLVIAPPEEGAAPALDAEAMLARALETMSPAEAAKAVAAATGRPKREIYALALAAKRDR